MFYKQGPALEPILRGLGTKRWEKAFNQGYKVGFELLPESTHRSKIYRQPKFAAIPWETGYARGMYDRYQKETGIREKDSFIGQHLLREIQLNKDIVFKEDSDEG